MRSFNILDPEAPLFGRKLLEASAGTGKTFAIEHLVSRLVFEAGIPLEQILVITFTRAATRELRSRIRKRIYNFDRAQIFTIHGFCQRMLMRFDGDAQMEPPSLIKMRSALAKAISKQDVLSPEQLAILLTRRSMSELCDALIQESPPELGGSFSEDHCAIQKAMELCPRGSLREEYERISSHYKKSTKNDDVQDQLAALEALPKQSALQRLIFWKGALLRTLSPENRKVRSKEKVTAPYFDWASTALLPLIEHAVDSKRLFLRLRFSLQPLFEEKRFFSPDLLLDRCCKASRDPAFCAAMPYQAVLIDEFQDTDAVQWEMIERLFFDKPVFCLVGDPKQSIYRFRKADLYTYFRAREKMGTENCYSLDTNYRSTPELLSALNLLFGEEYVDPWLSLPRQNCAYPYLPLKSGVEHSFDFCDGKKAFQFFRSEHPPSYVAAEIMRLKNRGSCAVLVKGHAEAAEVQGVLQSHGIEATVRNQSPLSRSPSFRLIEEFVDQHADRVPFHLPHILREMAPVPDFWEIAEQLLLRAPQSYEQTKRTFRVLELEEVPRCQEQPEHAVRILTMHASKGLEFDVVFALGVVYASPVEEEQEEQNAEKLRQLYVALTRAKRRVYVPLNYEEDSPLGLLVQKSKLNFEELRRSNEHIGIE